MKNIHLVPTENESRLFKSKHTGKVYVNSKGNTNRNCINTQNQYIYIVNDDKLKFKDYYFHTHDGATKVVCRPIDTKCKKIVLTNDPELIENGVKKIREDFLKWFVQNQYCEEVEVVPIEKTFNLDHMRERQERGLPYIYSEIVGYAIKLPKDTIKQQSDALNKACQEVIERYTLRKPTYSEEEVLDYLLSNPFAHQEEIKSWFHYHKKK